MGRYGYSRCALGCTRIIEVHVPGIDEGCCWMMEWHSNFMEGQRSFGYRSRHFSMRRIIDTLLARCQNHVALSCAVFGVHRRVLLGLRATSMTHLLHCFGFAPRLLCRFAATATATDDIVSATHIANGPVRGHVGFFVPILNFEGGS